MKFKYAVLIIVVCLSACNQHIQKVVEAPKPAKNIILLIGDGMGLTQVSTAYYFGEKTPNFSRFKHIGLHQNAPVGAKITDSASGATAFATGYKSYNKAIGVDKDTVARETILEWAAKNGKKTGLIATSSITHATPASFFAHVKSRHLPEEIAEDFVEAPVDFAAAGGHQYFAKREDEKNLLKALEAKGTIVDTASFGENINPNQPYACFLAPDSLHSIRGGRGDFLANATQTALDYLETDEDGFFLMIESSQIDWGGHANNAEYIITEVLDFDKTIGLALDFAEKDENTLVIVTADHETGGFSLSSAEAFGKRDYGIINPTFSTGGHSAALIPVFAAGVGAEKFTGIYQNNDLFFKMKNAFASKKLTR